VSGKAGSDCLPQIVNESVGPRADGSLMRSKWLQGVESGGSTAVPRMAGIGALQPIGSGRGLGRSCPIPAVRNTRRDQLSWVATCPWHPGFPPTAIRSQSGSATTFPWFGARRPERAITQHPRLFSRHDNSLPIPVSAGREPHQPGLATGPSPAPKAFRLPACAWGMQNRSPIVLRGP
jgi:hypothetical protein